MRKWPLQDAKAKFSEVMKRAASEGPQEITLRGEPKAVLLSRDAYDKMKGKKLNLAAFLRKSPLVGVKIKVERDKSLSRKVEL
ncbi:MAG: type II toxin-antitoxin system prevent-host-death family antitoxin [Proteobacteria bacterium]|jgi:prevent-host-death family protein|nr:MAG: type II toxin-antitoxin system prevent-host-death family antitoxin [Pseudomonadota bacterium]